MLAQKYWLLVDLRVSPASNFHYGCLLSRRFPMDIRQFYGPRAEGSWKLLEKRLDSVVDAWGGGKKKIYIVVSPDTI